MGCWVSLRTPTHGKSEKQSFGFHDPEAGQTSSVLLVSMSHKFNPPDIASLIGTGFSGLSMPFILLISPQFRFAGLPHRGLFKSSTTTVVIQLDNLLTPNQDPFRSQLFPVFRFGTPKIKKNYFIYYCLSFSYEIHSKRPRKSGKWFQEPGQNRNWIIDFLFWKEQQKELGYFNWISTVFQPYFNRISFFPFNILKFNIMVSTMSKMIEKVEESYNFAKRSEWVSLIHRGVAQSGSVHVWGACGRRFKSCHPDLIIRELREKKS